MSGSRGILGSHLLETMGISFVPDIGFQLTDFDVEASTWCWGFSKNLLYQYELASH